MDMTRLALLALSIYGFVYYFSKYIKAELCLGFTFSLISILVFLGGLLDALYTVTFEVFIIGLILLVISLMQNRPIKNTLTVGTVFFVVMCVFMFFLLKDARCTIHDNFSHWAQAAKIMLENNRFLIADDNIIFQSYQLGSSSLIYFMAKVCGTADEGFMLWAQAVGVISMASSLFAFCKKPVTYVCISISTLILLVCNTNFADLLVDNLVSFVAIAAVVFTVYYKDELCTKKAIFVLPYLAFLICLKNSGVIYILFIIIVSLIVSKPRWWALLSMIAVPALYFAGWIMHTRLVFADPGSAKHSMTIENFTNIYGLKNSEQISEIISSIAKRIFSFDNAYIYIFIATVILLVLVLIQQSFKLKRTLAALSIFSIVSYLLYQVGLAGMYIFSMPTSEALNLGAFDRYERCIIVFELGLLAIILMLYVEKIKDERWAILKVVLLIMLLLVTHFGGVPNYSYYKKQDLSQTKRGNFEYLLAQRSIPKGKKVLLVEDTGYEDYDYYELMATYRLDPSVVELCRYNNLINWQINIRYYDYVMILNPTQEITEFFVEHYHTMDRVFCPSECIID